MHRTSLALLVRRRRPRQETSSPSVLSSIWQVIKRGSVIDPQQMIETARPMAGPQ